MKVIIAGTRTFSDFSLLSKAMERIAAWHPISEVVHGGARGADALGSQWSKQNRIPQKCFPADWQTHGLRAGPLRNRQMAQYGDVLIAFWDGQSPGTKNMIQEAVDRQLYVYVVRYDAKRVDVIQPNLSAWLTSS